MKKILFVLVAVASMVACRHDDRPADLIEAPRMVDFLSDAYLLEGFYAIETQYRYDAMPAEVLRAYDDILAKHHLSREQVERSFDYYSNHPDLYGPIQDSVLVRIERETASDTIDAKLPNPNAEIRLSL